MKKYFIVLTAILLIVVLGGTMLLTACGAKTTTTPTSSQPAASSTAPAQALTLKYLRPWAADSPSLAAANEWIKRVNDRGKGIVQIKDIGGPEVFPQDQQFALLKNGQTDFLLSCAAYVSDSFPELNIITFNFTQPPAAMRKAGVYDVLDQISRPRLGVSFLGPMNFGYFTLFTKKEIKSMADLKGLKFRSVSSYEPVLRGLGIVPVTINRSEVYNALQTGLIDGTAGPQHGIVEDSLQEVCKTEIYPPFWQWSDCGLMMNSKSMDTLPANAKKIILDTLYEVEAEMPKIFLPGNQENADKAKAAGMKYYTMTDQEWFNIQKIQWEDGMKSLILDRMPETGAKLKAAVESAYPPKDVLKAPWNY